MKLTVWPTMRLNGRLLNGRLLNGRLLNVWRVVAEWRLGC